MFEKIHADDSHEGVLEAVLQEMLLDGSQGGLAEWAEMADATPLTDSEGENVHIVTAQTFEQAMVLTRDRGVMVRLSDGAEFAISISRYRNPH